MDNKHDGLWQGGPWEQPSQPVPNLPYIPVPAAGIPVLRPRKRRRKWPWITGLAILVLALCLLTVVLGRHLSFSLSGPGYLPAEHPAGAHGDRGDPSAPGSCRTGADLYPDL